MKVPQKLTIVSQLTLRHYCIVTFIINGIFVSKKGKPPPAFVDNIASVIVTNHHSQWSYNCYHHLHSCHENHLQKQHCHIFESSRKRQGVSGKGRAGVIRVIVIAITIIIIVITIILYTFFNLHIPHGHIIDSSRQVKFLDNGVMQLARGGSIGVGGPGH